VVEFVGGRRLAAQQGGALQRPFRIGQHLEIDRPVQTYLPGAEHGERPVAANSLHQLEVAEAMRHRGPPSRRAMRLASAPPTAIGAASSSSFRKNAPAAPAWRASPSGPTHWARSPSATESAG